MPGRQEVPAGRLGIPPEHARAVEPGAPRALRLAAARGALGGASLPGVIAMAYALLGDEDDEVRQAALDTLLGIPADRLTGALDARTHPKILEFFAEYRRSEREVARRIVGLRQANDRTACLVASDADAELAEDLLHNHERLLMTPEVALALRDNPEVPDSLVERVVAFLRMHEALPEGLEAAKDSPPGADAPPEPTRAVVEAEVEAALLGLPSPSSHARLEMFDLARSRLDLGTFQFGFEDETEGFSLDMLRESDSPMDEEERIGIERQIREMSPGRKIRLAYLGNAEVRRILIRDRNKMVATAVVRSGRMTESEVNAAATNRSLDAEVIRELCRNKEYLRRYAVKVALANNPKTPVALATSLVGALRKADLKRLALNKNVSPTVSQQAARALRRHGGR